MSSAEEIFLKARVNKQLQAAGNALVRPEDLFLTSPENALIITLSILMHVICPRRQDSRILVAGLIKTSPQLLHLGSVLSLPVSADNTGCIRMVWQKFRMKETAKFKITQFCRYPIF